MTTAEKIPFPPPPGRVKEAYERTGAVPERDTFILDLRYRAHRPHVECCGLTACAAEVLGVDWAVKELRSRNVYAGAGKIAEAGVFEGATRADLFAFAYGFDGVSADTAESTFRAYAPDDEPVVRESFRAAWEAGRAAAEALDLDRRI